MKIKDVDIRRSLHAELHSFFSYDATTQVIDEMEICNGVVRVDVAALNGALHGYEIKSESDTLLRLPKQAEYYNKVFDYMYFVCSDSKASEALTLIPDWWGVYVAYKSGEGVTLQLERKASRNTDIDALVILQFLRKEEALELAQNVELESERRLLNMTKYQLSRRLAEKVDMGVISEFVRVSLKARCDWRTRMLQMQCDG